MSVPARFPKLRIGDGIFPVAVFALAARLIPVPFAVRRLPAILEAGFANDGADSYLPLAHSLAEHGTYAMSPGHSSAFGVPLYPLLLAALERLGLLSIAGLVLTQALLGGVALVLIFVWVRRLAGPRAALVALGLAAALPDFAVYSYLNLSENLAIVLVLAALTLFDKASHSGRPQWMVLTGVMIGLAALTREFCLTLLIPLGASVLGREGVIRAARSVALMALGSFLILLPWVVRNYVAFGELILLSEKGGLGLYVSTLKGQHNFSDPRRGSAVEEGQWEVHRQLEQRLATARTAGARNRFYFEAAWRNYRDDPLGQLGYMARKAQFFWKPNVGLRHRQRAGLTPLLVLAEVLYWLCLAASAGGLWLRGVRKEPGSLLALLIGWTFVFHLFVGEAEPRYHFLVLPAVFACASLSMGAWLRSLGASGRGGEPLRATV